MPESPENLRLSPLLTVFPGLVFEFAVRLRNLSFDRSLRRQQRLAHPVISVGNLTMGGSGKTPLVIHIARMIARLHRVPVLLSRGYGRLSRQPQVVTPGAAVAAPVDSLGDEPALIRRREPQLWVGISSNRYAIGKQIEGRTAGPVFLLDDGFQHRRLHRDLDILVIDRTQPLSLNRVFPRGSLREPVSGLGRAGLVMINGGFPDPPDPLGAEIRRIKPDASLFHCSQRIGSLMEYARWNQHEGGGVPDVSASSAFLVAAIGNPGRFANDVREYGIEVRGARFFRDHYRLNAVDWRECAEAARRTGAAALLTTEKDAIKLCSDLDYPLLVAIQSMQVHEESAFELMVRLVIEGKR
jgi:tetraacyldisaccharide 4'-kinase